eukprot:1029816-Prorocentrum_minimum.AAC.2
MYHSAWECVLWCCGAAVWQLSNESDFISGMNLKGEGGLELGGHTPTPSRDTVVSQSDSVVVSPTAPTKKKIEVYTTSVEQDEIEVYTKAVEQDEIELLELGPTNLEPGHCSWTLVQPQLTFKGESLNGVVGPTFIGSRRSKETFQRR